MPKYTRLGHDWSLPYVNKVKAASENLLVKSIFYPVHFVYLVTLLIMANLSELVKGFIYL